MNGPDPDILHVEDDPLTVELMRRALGRLPAPPRYEVVSDGEQALTRLGARPHPPGLLLLDLQLPRLGGLPLLAALRRSPATRGLPVVVFTTSQEPQDVAQAYALGANSYVLKPLEYEEFCATVQQLVDYWLHTNQRAGPA